MTTEQLKALVRDVPDFPQAGIIFKDLMPLIGNAAAFHATIGHLAEWARPRTPDVILGAEARGFIFGGALAYELGCGFVPARKPGKLPWVTTPTCASEWNGTSTCDGVTRLTDVDVHVGHRTARPSASAHGTSRRNDDGVTGRGASSR